MNQRIRALPRSAVFAAPPPPEVRGSFPHSSLPVDRETITPWCRTTSPPPRRVLRGRARRAQRNPKMSNPPYGRRGRSPRSAEELQHVLDDERLVDRPAARDAFSRILRMRKKFRTRWRRRTPLPGSIDTFAAPAAAATRSPPGSGLRRGRSGATATSAAAPPGVTAHRASSAPPLRSRSFPDRTAAR